MKKVRFSLSAPGAKQVLLAADFTDWEAHARRMKRTKPRSRTFAATVTLARGTYEYKFIVDGEWVEDPKAESVMNRLGSRNSLATVSE
jgi:1,4-alpha-glucan branching enzyme